MKCTYHPLRDAGTQCKNCFAPLCDDCIIHGEGKKKVLCSRCVAIVAGAESFQEILSASIERKVADQQQLEAREKKKKRLMFVQCGVIALALLVVSFQVPRIIELIQPDKPLRIGTDQTDAITDKCVQILWQVAKLLQEGDMPGEDMVCPASNEPFEIIRADGDIIARVPHPELYGFRELRVSKNRPVPEVIK